MENTNSATKKDGNEIVVHVHQLQPLDAFLLDFETTAAYIGSTADGVRALLKGTHKGDMELANVLRLALVTISPHRRFIKKDILFDYLRRKAGLTTPTNS